jgi:signal transduction histidine kinase
VADEPARQRFESVDLAGLFAEEAARVGVPLDLIEPVPAGHEIRGDARLLRRLLRNLLENAVRHGGGEDSVQARLAHDGARWCVEVLDRGAGVPADERERIFEPFYRSRGASEREGGVGLGLSLVRQIAVHHGGSVVCESREGGGSRFVARLPDAGQ